MNKVNFQADTLIHTFILVKRNIYDEVCHKRFFNTTCMVYLMHHEGIQTKFSCCMVIYTVLSA